MVKFISRSLVIFIQSVKGRVDIICKFFWFFDLLMSVVFGIVLTVTLYAVYAQIGNKYQFDGITPAASPNTISVPENQKGDRKEHAESQSESKSE